MGQFLRFDELNPALTTFLLETLTAMNFIKMTPVQASVIPLFSQHKDVVVEAVTGSGKTLAYAIPTIERLLKRSKPLLKREIGAVIILPTRELAIQVHKVLESLLSAQPEGGLSLAPPLLLTGGARSIKEDVAEYLDKGASMLIGTPGRLEEFLLGSSSLATDASNKKKSITVVANTKQLEVVILDEADRLLDLGFTASLTRLLLSFPKQRRTGLFSATMTDALAEIVRIGLRNPVKIVVKVEAKKNVESRTPAGLQNFFVVCRARDKLLRMAQLLQIEANDASSKKFIVYFSTCAAVDYFYKVFSQMARFEAFALHSLHGQQAPSRRTSTFEAFTKMENSKPAVLLCTDVAARGLDLPDVDCVIQVDPPQDPKVFAHRCGRTARAGRGGRAYVLLLEGREEDYADFLKLRKISLQPTPPGRLPGPNDSDAGDFVEEMRAVVKTDRDLDEKGSRALVSAIQAYSKHEASYIFRVKDLDLPAVAVSYGLLRLPRMPELKDADLSSWKAVEMDWDAYAFQDATRESKRKADLENEATSKARKDKKRKPAKQTEAWSDKKAKKMTKEARREKRIQDSMREAQAQELAEEAASKEIQELREDEKEFSKKRKLAHGQQAVVGSFGGLE